MKHSASMQHLQNFVYIDSSEEEVQQQQQKRQENNNKLLHRDYFKGKDKLKEQNYKKQLKQLIALGIQKLQYGNAVLVQPNDHDIHENIIKRKQKYNYFLKQVEIDDKYKDILNQKVQKLKEQNRKKEEVLRKKRQIQQHRDEEDMLKKYQFEKKLKQQKVLIGVKKIVHKLGVERNVLSGKQLKANIKSERIITHNKLSNLQKKQKNELEQLRELYQQIKVQKKLNKMDQQKVVKDMDKQIQKHKEQLKEQLKLKTDFVV